MSSVFKVGGLALVLLAVSIVYFPGLKGPFIFDDAPNLMENQKVHIKELSFDTIRDAVFSIQSGPLYRPVSMLSVALNYYWGGDEVWGYKAVNIMIHCLSTLAVFYLAFNLLRALALLQPERSQFDTPRQQWAVALVVAGIWGLHPLNLTSVLYVIQRMASLAGLFTFLSVALYLQGRIALHQSQRGVLWYWLGAALSAVFGVFSKESAVLAPLFVALVEGCVGRWSAPGPWKPFFRCMKVLSYLGLLAFAALLVYYWDYLMGGFRNRPFTVEERLLTELRVLWHYLSWSLIPDIHAMGLFHDDIPVSLGLLNPPTTLLSLVGILLTLLLAWLLLPLQPLMALAIFWFFTAHLLESTIVPIELVHEHRNYVALLGPILLIVLSLHQIAEKIKLRVRVRVVCALAIGVALASQTYARSFSWSSYQNLMEVEFENHPHSTRILYENGRLWYVYVTLADNAEDKQVYYRKARTFLERTYLNDKDDLAALPGLIRLQLLMGRAVKMEWLNELEQRLKSRSIRGPKLRHVLELVECRLSGACQLPFDDVHRLLSATLNNPHGMEPIFRAAFFNAQGALKWTEGQYIQAADYFRSAYATNPDPKFVTSALNAYIEGGDYMEAQSFARTTGLSEQHIEKIFEGLD